MVLTDRETIGLALDKKAAAPAVSAELPFALRRKLHDRYGLVVRSGTRTVSLDAPRTETVPGVFADVFGASPGVKPLSDPSAFASYAFPRANEKRVRAAMEDLPDARSGLFRISSLSSVLFEEASALAGCNALLDPDNGVFAHRLLEKICGYTLALMDAAADYDFEAFLLEDDWSALDTGSWNRLVLPYFARFCAEAKACGKRFIVLVRGGWMLFAPGLKRLGADAAGSAGWETADAHAAADCPFAVWGIPVPGRIGEWKAAFSSGGWIARIPPDITADAAAAVLRELL